MSGDLDKAIDALPPAVGRFFRCISVSDDYSCNALTMQMTISFRGEKVGGLNRRLSEWYLSKVFIAKHGGPTAAERRGFRRIDKHQSGKAPHIYWVLSGPDALENFEAVIVEMTGISIVK